MADSDVQEFNWEGSLSKYWYWHGVPTMVACEYDPTMQEAEVGLTGIPVCSGNTADRSQYRAPRAVRTMSMAHHRANRALQLDPFPGGGGPTTYHATTVFYELTCLVADSLPASKQ